jgi:DNA-binding NtrC family response regulator
LSALARQATRPQHAADSPSLSLRVARAPHLLGVLHELAAAVVDALPAAVTDRVSLAVLEPDGASLRVYRLLPLWSALPDTLPMVRVEGTPVGAVARDGQPRVIDDLRHNDDARFGRAAHDGIRSTASVPVRLAGRVVGVLNVGGQRPGACTSALVEPMAELAAVLGPLLLAAETAAAGQPPHAPKLNEELIAHDPAMVALMQQVRRAAVTDVPVLLTGETGVGKTRIARAIHELSRRAREPFAAVHLADLPATLVESELFGHERGAFTGATDRHLGRFEQVGRGTLFLDEIAETPLSVQAKLLRVTHDGQFERIGGSATLRSEARIIAATHRDLQRAASEGLFRSDLLYRLDVVNLRVPALRERPADLGPLTERILARLEQQLGRALRLSGAAWAKLRLHPWPGNVRELDNVLTRAAVLEDGEILHLTSWQPAGHPQASMAVAPPTAPWPTRDEHERRYLAQVLAHTAGRIEGPRGAAAVLGMLPSTLRSRLDRLGVDWRAGGRP